MERERLTRLMHEPTRVAKEDLAGLQELTAKYPWFSAAHLLLAVGEHTTGDVLYDERARTAAAHLPQRSVLFDLVHTDVNTAPSVRVEPTHLSVVSATVPEPTPQTEPVQAMEVPVAVVPEPIHVEPVVQPAAEAPMPVSVPVDDPLDKQIRQAAMASGYELLLEHSPLPAPTQRPEPPAATVAPAAELPPLPDPLPQPLPVATAPVQAPTPPRHTVRLRFTDWLDTSAEAQVSAPAAQPQAEPAHTDWLYSKPAVVTPSVEPLGQAPVELPTVVTPTVDPLTLIDRFIKQEHPEPVKRTEFFTPQQAAKRSLEDHAELVTETLARIYEKQGNIPKAITAYKRLAERHPDKGAYFLGLAKALEGRGKA